MTCIFITIEIIHGSHVVCIYDALRCTTLFSLYFIPLAECDESDNEGDIVTGAQHRDNGTQDNNDQEDHEMFSADKLLKLQTT
jgi:hypothetical protein